MTTLQNDTTLREVTLVTPDKAKEWLAGTSRNRPVSKAHVQRLRGAIERGEWVHTGDAVMFDQDGRLVNGQHRLTAIAEAGQACVMDVLWGVSDEVVMVTDQPKKRSLRDWLNTEGYPSATQLAATIRAAYTLEWFVMEGLTRAGADWNPTIHQQLATFDRHPTLQQSTFAIDAIRKNASHAGVSPPFFRGAVVATILDVAKADDNTAEALDFATAILTGENLSSEEPAFNFRRWLFQLERRGGSTGRPDSRLFAYGFYKAWNQYVINKPNEFFKLPTRPVQPIGGEAWMIAGGLWSHDDQA